MEPELPATGPALDVGVGDDFAIVAFLDVVTTVPTGSDEIDVGMAMETAVAFPAVRREVGMVASGDAVRGSLKMSHISAMA